MGHGDLPEFLKTTPAPQKTDDIPEFLKKKENWVSNCQYVAQFCDIVLFERQ